MITTRFLVSCAAAFLLGVGGDLLLNILALLPSVIHLSADLPRHLPADILLKGLKQKSIGKIYPIVKVHSKYLAAMLRHCFRELLRHESALLPGNLATLLPWNIAAGLAGSVHTHFLGNIHTHLLGHLDVMAGGARHRDTDRLLHHGALLLDYLLLNFLGNIFTFLEGNILALLIGNVFADLFRDLGALLLRHILTLHGWSVLGK